MRVKEIRSSIPVEGKVCQQFRFVFLLSSSFLLFVGSVWISNDNFINELLNSKIQNNNNNNKRNWAEKNRIAQAFFEFVCDFFTIFLLLFSSKVQNTIGWSLTWKSFYSYTSVYNIHSNYVCLLANVVVFWTFGLKIDSHCVLFRIFMVILSLARKNFDSTIREISTKPKTKLNFFWFENTTKCEVRAQMDRKHVKLYWQSIESNILLRFLLWIFQMNNECSRSSCALIVTQMNKSNAQQEINEMEYIAYEFFIITKYQFDWFFL